MRRCGGRDEVVCVCRTHAACCCRRLSPIGLRWGRCFERFRFVCWASRPALSCPLAFFSKDWQCTLTASAGVASAKPFNLLSRPSLCIFVVTSSEV